MKLGGQHENPADEGLGALAFVLIGSAPLLGERMNAVGAVLFGNGEK